MKVSFFHRGSFVECSIESVDVYGADDEHSFSLTLKFGDNSSSIGTARTLEQALLDAISNAKSV